MEFMKLFDKVSSKYQSLELDILWDKIGDWQIRVVHGDSDTTIFEGNLANLDYLMAQALIALYDWLDEKEN